MIFIEQSFHQSILELEELPRGHFQVRCFSLCFSYMLVVLRSCLFVKRVALDDKKSSDFIINDRHAAAERKIT